MKFQAIQPSSDFFFIVLGSALVYFCSETKSSEGFGMLGCIFGVACLQYNLYSFALCKYYHLEIDYLTNVDQYNEKKGKYINSYSNPITGCDLFILILFLLNFWIYLLGIFNYISLYVISAQFGIMRLFVFFVATKKRAFVQICSTFLLFMMLILCYSFACMRDLFFREVLLNRCLMIYFSFYQDLARL